MRSTLGSSTEPPKLPLNPPKSSITFKSLTTSNPQRSNDLLKPYDPPLKLRFPPKKLALSLMEPESICLCFDLLQVTACQMSSCSLSLALRTFECKVIIFLLTLELAGYFATHIYSEKGGGGLPW